MEAIGRLAGGVAHDFNNLLTVISGYAEILLDAPERPARERARARSRTPAEQAAGADAPAARLQPPPGAAPAVLDLNEIVAGMEPMLQPDHRRGRQRRHRGSRPTCAPVEADRAQIEQVILNLAVNARDAMPTAARLTIETANVELDERLRRRTRRGHGRAARAARGQRHRHRHERGGPARTCSSRSSPPRSRARAPGSASRPCTASSSRAAAASTSTARRAAARRSRSTCRRPARAAPAAAGAPEPRGRARHRDDPGRRGRRERARARAADARGQRLHGARRRATPTRPRALCASGPAASTCC